MAAGVGAYTTASNPATSIAKPTGVVSGSLLMVGMFHVGTGAPTMSGFTKLSTEADYGTNIHLSVFWKLAGGSEPSTYSWTANGNSVLLTIMIRVDEADATGTIEASSATDNGLLNTTTAPSVSPTDDNALLVLFAAAYPTSGGLTDMSPPAGMTEVTEVNISATYYQAVAWKQLSSAGATGAQGYTMVGPAEGTCVNLPILVAIRTAVTDLPYTAAVPLMTGSGSAPAPALSVPATVTIPPMSGSGSVPAVAVKASAVLAVPVSSASGDVIDPVIRGSAKIAAPVMTGSGDVVDPAVLSEDRIAVPAMTGTGAMLAPTLQAGAKVAIPVMTASGVVPALSGASGAASVGVPAMTGFGDVPPVLVYTANEFTAAIPLMTGSGFFPPPQAVGVTKLRLRKPGDLRSVPLAPAGTIIPVHAGPAAALTPAPALFGAPLRPGGEHE